MNSKSPLEDNVLVLNKYYQPVHVIGVRDAMRLLTTQKCVVVDDQYNCFDMIEWASFSEDKTKNLIRSPRYKFVTPQVIRLLGFDRRARYTINFTRENIFIRDNWECQYCGTHLSRSEATLDHVIPKSRQDEFGLTKKEIGAWDNIVAACSSCNGRKADRTPKEARMELKTTPQMPDLMGRVRGLHPRNMKPSWQMYLETLRGRKK